MKQELKLKLKLSISILTVTSLVLICASSAAVGASAPGGVVTLTFDDGSLTTYTNAWPILAAAEQPGMLYVTTDYIGGNDFSMNWSQVQELHNNGWEIGAHSVTHAELPAISPNEAEDEINDCYDELLDYGIEAKSFATPFGAYNNEVLAMIAKKYASHRGYWERGLNAWPYNNYALKIQPVMNDTPIEQVKAWIDQATNDNLWLILSFHDVFLTEDLDDSYSNTVQELQEISDYLKNNNVPVKTVSQVLAHADNLVPNSSFENDWQDWTHNSAAQFQINNNNKGSYPAPDKSVEITGAAQAAHLLSQNVPVENGELYGIQAYLDSSFLTGGEVGFYIDEYNQQNEWISGQWLGAYNYQTVTQFNKQYAPGSAQVAMLNVQVYIAAGSQGHAFVDNVELFTTQPPTPDDPGDDPDDNPGDDPGDDTPDDPGDNPPGDPGDQDPGDIIDDNFLDDLKTDLENRAEDLKTNLTNMAEETKQRFDDLRQRLGQMRFN